MTSTAKKVLEQALALPSEDREELVGALSSSLEPVALSSEWESEIADRIRRVESGQAVFHDADEHLRKLRAKYSG